MDLPKQLHPEFVRLIPYEVVRRLKVIPMDVRDGDVGRTMVFGLAKGRRLNESEQEDLRWLAEGARLEFQALKVEPELWFLDFLYRATEANIRTCGSRFAFRCPKKWSELNVTDTKRVRFCDNCEKEVYLATSGLEFERHARKNRCVALAQFDEQNRGEKYIEPMDPDIISLGETIHDPFLTEAQKPWVEDAIREANEKTES